MQFHLFHKLCVITQLWALLSKQVLVQSSHKQGNRDYYLKVKSLNFTNQSCLGKKNENETRQELHLWLEKSTKKICVLIGLKLCFYSWKETQN